jgi:hypothetical protein
MIENGSSKMIEDVKINSKRSKSSSSVTSEEIDQVETHFLMI